MIQEDFFQMRRLTCVKCSVRTKRTRCGDMGSGLRSCCICRRRVFREAYTRIHNTAIVQDVRTLFGRHFLNFGQLGELVMASWGRPFERSTHTTWQTWQRCVVRFLEICDAFDVSTETRIFFWVCITSRGAVGGEATLYPKNWYCQVAHLCLSSCAGFCKIGMTNCVTVQYQVVQARQRIKFGYF